MSRLRLVVQKHIHKNNIFDIIEFFKDNKINTLHFLSCKILPLKLHNNILDGGIGDDSKIIKTNIRGEQIITKIYEYNDDNLKTINFVKIHSILDNNNEFSEIDHCGVLIYDDKIKEATIQSVNDYKDCLQCVDTRNKKFKIGDILIQIMIAMCIHKEIKKIVLTDNSYLLCQNEKIPLIYLRTMTKGEPFYTKYGFKPINHNDVKSGENDGSKNELKIFNDNIKIFNKNPSFSKEKLLRILSYKNFNKNEDRKMINYITKLIIPRLTVTNNLVKNFLNNIINDKTEESCDLLHNILRTIYKKCGYIPYKYKHFELNLKNKDFTNAVKNHIKFKNF
jgi:hypothetical protein